VSLWNTFLVQVLGLTPIPKKKERHDKSDGEVEGAFELLRVRILWTHRPLFFFQPLAGSQPLCLENLCWRLPRHELQNSRRVHVRHKERKAAFLQRVSSAALESFVMTSTYSRVQKALEPGRREDNGVV